MNRVMMPASFIRVLICVGAIALFLYAYLSVQNTVTRKRLSIPPLAKQIKELKEANECLHYEIGLFESPAHLIQLASRSEYAHLKQPLLKDIVALQQKKSPEEGALATSAASRFRVALGTVQK